jgi:class 3 adenylate cyclase/streptogramin lyase
VSGSSALVTVLFTDIVGSTQIASEMGDPRWRELLARHHRIVRSHLRRFGGKEIDTAGDGFFASFDRPAQAVRCAGDVVQAVRELGIEVRAGVHVGEAEVMGRGLGGVAVHTGARIASQARPGEVLVSGTLKDLIPGASFRFDDRGVRELKGVPGTHRTYALTAVDEAPIPPPLGPDEAARRRGGIAPPPVYRRRPVWVAALAVVIAATAAVATVVATRETRPPERTVARDALVVVDPATREVGTPIRLPPGPEVRYESSQVAVGAGGVWVLTGNCVCHLDAETREVTRVDVPLPNQMVVGLRAVWVASLNGFMVSIDPATLETAEHVSLPGQGGFHTSVAVTEDLVWTGFQRHIAPIDPVTEELGEVILLHHSVDDLIGVGNDLWVVDQLGKTLYRYDDRGHFVDSVQLQLTPDDVVAGPEGDLWVLNRSGGTVTPVGSDGAVGQPIRVGEDPSDLAVGPDAVWVAHHDGRTLQRIDPVLGQKDVAIRLPGPVTAVGVDPVMGHVWAYLD